MVRIRTTHVAARVHLDTLLTENEQLMDSAVETLDAVKKNQGQYSMPIPFSYVSDQPYAKVQELIDENNLPVPTMIAAGDMLVVNNDYLLRKGLGETEYGILPLSDFPSVDAYDIWHDGKEVVVGRKLARGTREPAYHVGFDEGLRDIALSQDYLEVP